LVGAVLGGCVGRIVGLVLGGLLGSRVGMLVGAGEGTVVGGLEGKDVGAGVGTYPHAHTSRLAGQGFPIMEDRLSKHRMVQMRHAALTAGVGRNVGS
jgi:hypothetical protein